MFIVFILVIGLVAVSLIKSSTKELIIAGTGNSGKIFVYQFEKDGIARNQIDTGFKLVHVVKIGDALNNGRQVIVAGVSNSFYGPPFGCSLLLYYPERNFDKELVDNVGDLRCKDISIGDADNDGKNEIVLGTHGEGIINLYEWNGSKWNKQEIERNFIKQIDEKEGTNHKVSLNKLTYSTVVQTAIHTVKIGDVDNDGKNEIAVTESSPLEYTEGPQISFVNIYKFDGKSWNRTIIHRVTGSQHRSILIDDVNYDRSNEVLIGTVPGKLFMLKYNENGKGNWSSTLIFNQTLDKNMKGIDFQDIYSKGKKTIVLATGIPNGLIYTLEWGEKGFQNKLIGNISQIFEQYNVIKNLNYNSLEVQAKDVDNDGKMEIIVGGEADTSLALDKLKPQDNIFGWEATPYGFLVIYKFDGKVWNPLILDSYSVLGMNVGNIS